MPIKNWSLIYDHLMIYFVDRVEAGRHTGDTVKQMSMSAGRKAIKSLGKSPKSSSCSIAVATFSSNRMPFEIYLFSMNNKNSTAQDVLKNTSNDAYERGRYSIGTQIPGPHQVDQVRYAEQ